MVCALSVRRAISRLWALMFLVMMLRRSDRVTPTTVLMTGWLKVLLVLFSLPMKD